MDYKEKLKNERLLFYAIFVKVSSVRERNRLRIPRKKQARQQIKVMSPKTPPSLLT
jgi:hypothetical protein